MEPEAKRKREKKELFANRVRNTNFLHQYIPKILFSFKNVNGEAEKGARVAEN